MPEPRILFVPNCQITVAIDCLECKNAIRLRENMEQEMSWLVIAFDYSVFKMKLKESPELRTVLIAVEKYN